MDLATLRRSHVRRSLAMALALLVTVYSLLGLLAAQRWILAALVFLAMPLVLGVFLSTAFRFLAEKVPAGVLGIERRTPDRAWSQAFLKAWVRRDGLEIYRRVATFEGIDPSPPSVWILSFPPPRSKDGTGRKVPYTLLAIVVLGSAGLLLGMVSARLDVAPADWIVHMIVAVVLSVLMFGVQLRHFDWMVAAINWYVAARTIAVAAWSPPTALEATL